MKSIRFKVLAMLGIVAAGALLSAALGLYALSRSNDLNARSDIQGEIALVTERINTQVFAVVMDSRGIYMSKDAKEAEAFAKPKEARFPGMRKLASELVALVPAQERETALKLQKSVDEFIAFRSETIRLGREVSTAAANQQGNNDQNRANRKALNDQLVAFSKRNEDVGSKLAAEAADFTRQIQWILPLVLLSTLIASIAAAVAFSRRAIVTPLLDLGGRHGAGLISGRYGRSRCPTRKRLRTRSAPWHVPSPCSARAPSRSQRCRNRSALPPRNGFARPTRCPSSFRMSARSSRLRLRVISRRGFRSKMPTSRCRSWLLASTRSIRWSTRPRRSLSRCCALWRRAI
jgi:CHASE3 domain sensor protein